MALRVKRAEPLSFRVLSGRNSQSIQNPLSLYQIAPWRAKENGRIHLEIFSRNVLSGLDFSQLSQSQFANSKRSLRQTKTDGEAETLAFEAGSVIRISRRHGPVDRQSFTESEAQGLSGSVRLRHIQAPHDRRNRWVEVTTGTSHKVEVKHRHRGYLSCFDEAVTVVRDVSPANSTAFYAPGIPGTE